MIISVNKAYFSHLTASYISATQVTTSAPLPVKSGVPQGSHSWPFTFSHLHQRWISEVQINEVTPYTHNYLSVNIMLYIIIRRLQKAEKKW